MMTLAAPLKDCWIDFKRTITPAELPGRFNFPFYHEPHPLCLEAAAELQDYIQTQTEWQHNFGLDPAMDGLVIGKMFGVMLVQKQGGEVGYITAFSGKLADKNAHSRFVPPIFDMLAPDSFFLKGEEVISKVNEAIEALEQSAELKIARQQLQNKLTAADTDLRRLKDKIKANKARRKLQRADAEMALCEEGRADLLESLRQESVREQGEFKFMQRYWKEQAAPEQAALDRILDEIEALKEERKAKSANLQEQLFAQYNFLDQYGALKNVKEIFAHTAFDNPPSGAGECAAPKMLQFAFLHGLKPLAFAEFWWGASPASEIRKHGQFYPACRGKCEPILAHMLNGIELDPNPMLQQQDLGDALKTIYEDEQIVVVDKPAELLSVPGKISPTSVQDILQKRYPHATGPLLVHRLDMATSGILIAAKTKEAHEYLQAQFIKKTTRKSYIAVLDGVLAGEEGTIELPLRVDLDNRPHQVVCYEYGKPAVTKWKKLSVTGKHTRVQLFPITGRTHQLRMHCAHHLGLDMPIVGDDLYGTKADRLHLHAQSLSIKHPATRQEMTFTSEPPF
ncbi:MAG: RNA pseudouridine synthase [Taibaiella sp.]|nr:RNA pseudouridine synthase [Taibaiella sp.]